MQEVVTVRAALRAAAAALAVAASGPAVPAITLGDVEVRSALGQALDARIPVTSAPGDTLRGACFSVAPDASGALPALPGATLELRRSAAGARLRVQTKAPVQDPAVALGIAIACPGTDAAVERKEYSILLDPPRVAAAAPSATPALATPAIATLGAQPGDTLASIAAKIFPRDRNARRAYLAAIRADNPALASLSDTDPLPADAQVALPDLRTFMKAAPAPRALAAAEEPGAPSVEAPAPRARSRPRAPERATAQPAPAPAALPSARSEAPALAAAEPPPAPRAERAPHAGATRAAEPRGAFRLKLSAPVVDLAPTRSMNEPQRAALRARLMVLDSDDQTAAMLAMQDSIRRLETQVSELQLKLTGMPTPAAPVVEPPAAKAESAPPPKAEPAPAANAELRLRTPNPSQRRRPSRRRRRPPRRRRRAPRRRRKPHARLRPRPTRSRVRSMRSRGTSRNGCSRACSPRSRCCSGCGCSRAAAPQAPRRRSTTRSPGTRRSP